jgi:hypothetical protein
VDPTQYQGIVIVDDGGQELGLEGNMKYFGNWSDYSSMIGDWGNITKHPIPSDPQVLFASYGTEEYEGDAVVVFVHEGQLYEVNGGHCSCYGLGEQTYSGDTESQWEPEITSWGALNIRTLDANQHTLEAITAFKTLVAEHL